MAGDALLFLNVLAHIINLLVSVSFDVCSSMVVLGMWVSFESYWSGGEQRAPQRLHFDIVDDSCSNNFLVPARDDTFPSRGCVNTRSVLVTA